MLGATILDERVDELRLNKIRGVQLVKDQAEAPEIIRNSVRGSDPGHPDLGVLPHLGLQVVLDPSKDCQTSHQDRVGVIPFGRVLAELDKSVDAAKTEQVPANVVVIAEPENWSRNCLRLSCDGQKWSLLGSLYSKLKDY